MASSFLFSEYMVWPASARASFNLITSERSRLFSSLRKAFPALTFSSSASNESSKPWGLSSSLIPGFDEGIAALESEPDSAWRSAETSCADEGYVFPDVAPLWAHEAAKRTAQRPSAAPGMQKNNARRRAANALCREQLFLNIRAVFIIFFFK